MSAFFDTNILVYAQRNGAKADKARALLAGGGVLSVQVLNAAVARRKLGKGGTKSERRLRMHWLWSSRRCR